MTDTVAVVLAGGIGQRFGATVPKQLLKLAGRTILEHTISIFDDHPLVDDVIVLMTPGWTSEITALVGGFPKVSAIVEGGATRTESTWRALRALGPAERNVLLHDAVRPLTEARVITDCVHALASYQAVHVAIPTTDTILVAEGNLVADVPDRSTLRRAQTPQCFKLSLIRDAYAQAMADPGFGTASDDIGVVRRYRPEVPIFIVEGSERNLKVTHPGDLLIAESLLRSNADEQG